MLFFNARLTRNVEKENDGLEQQDYINNLYCESQQTFPVMSRSKAKTPIYHHHFGLLYCLFQNKSKESRPIISTVFNDETWCLSDIDMAFLFSELQGSVMFNVVFVLLGYLVQMTPNVKGKKIWFSKLFEM